MEKIVVPFQSVPGKTVGLVLIRQLPDFVPLKRKMSTKKAASRTALSPTFSAG